MINPSTKLIRSTLIKTTLIVLPPFIITVWAQYQLQFFSNDLDWAEYYGALLSSSKMNFNEGWRLLIAPLLHYNIKHLLSNTLLIAIATLIDEASVKSHTYFLKLLSDISRVYLWGAFIALMRVTWGVEAWSMGLSGAALALLSQQLCRVALSSQVSHPLQKLFLYLAPWGLILIDIRDNVDLVSHILGVGLGSSWATLFFYIRRKQKVM
jgi:membrane associated rhomboid family serine protease